MQKNEVPEFLLANIHTMDKTRLLDDLRLLMLWQTVNGERPFDYESAIKLQRQLKTQYVARLKKTERERIFARQKAENESFELHNEIGRIVFDVELLGQPDEVDGGVIDWNKEIRDKISKRNFGTPKSLFQSINMDFRRRIDARENLDGYLEELKENFDGWSYEFVFSRDMSSYDLGKYSQYFRFTLRLKWKSQPISRYLRKKIRKLGI